MTHCLSQTRSIKPLPEDLLHDDPIDIARMPSQHIRLVERSNKNPTIESSDLVAFKDHFETNFSVLEAKITNDAKLVKI